MATATAGRRRAGCTAIAAVLLALAGPSGAAAQQRASAAARSDVRLRVVQILSVRGVRDLDFGDIVASAAGTTKDVDKADPNAGQFEVLGPDGQRVQVSFVSPGSLRRAEGAGSIPVTLAVYAARTPAAAPGAERVLTEGTVTLSDGRYYLFVAGSITVRDAKANPAGTYTGRFELSVSYTAI